MAQPPTGLTSRALEASSAPPFDRTVTLDVRDLGPPKPLTETLERLESLSTDTVLVQLNDRAPQHLFPRLSSRGFDYDTIEMEDVVVTAIWPTD